MLLFLSAHEAVMLNWGLAFGLHLLLLCYLVYKSGYLPRMVGMLLSIAALCYFIQSFGTMLLPQSKAVFTAIGLLSTPEIALPLWLLMKSVNVEQRKKRVLAAA